MLAVAVASCSEAPASGVRPSGRPAGEAPRKTVRAGEETLRYAPTLAQWAGDREAAAVLEVDAPGRREARVLAVTDEAGRAVLAILRLVPQPPDGAVAVTDAEVVWRPGTAPVAGPLADLGRAMAAPGNRVRRRPSPPLVRAWKGAADPTAGPRALADWLATLDAGVVGSPSRLAACHALVAAGGPFRLEAATGRTGRLTGPGGAAEVVRRAERWVVVACAARSAARAGGTAAAGGAGAPAGPGR